MRNLFIIFYSVLCILTFCLTLIFPTLYGLYKHYYIHFIGKIVKYAHRENVNSQTASGRWILDIFDLGYKSILDITRSWI